MTFIYFLYLISLATPSSTVLSNGSKKGHPCFVYVFRGKAFSLLPVSMKLALDFFIDALYQIEEIFDS